MGISSGKSKNKATNSGNFQQGVWNPWGGAWGNMAGQAGQVGDWSTGGMMGQGSQDMGGVADDMRNAWQGQLGGGAYAGVDANEIISGINKSIGQPSESGKMYADIMGGSGNAYLGGMQDQMKSNAYDTMMQSMKGLDARAAASGMSGGSRHGLAQGQAIQDVNKNLQSDMTNLGYQSFDKDLQNKLGIAGMADQNTLARQGMLTDMLGQKQGAMTGGLGFGQNMQGAYMSPWMAPWQAMGAWGNTLGGPVMEGSGSMAGGASGKSKSGGFGGFNPFG